MVMDKGVGKSFTKKPAEKRKSTDVAEKENDRSTFRGGRGGGYRSGYQAPTSSLAIEQAVASYLAGKGGQQQAWVAPVASHQPPMRCYKCNELSHVAKNCPN